MTYNVFGGTLNLAQSVIALQWVTPGQCHSIGQWLRMGHVLQKTAQDQSCQGLERLYSTDSCWCRRNAQLSAISIHSHIRQQLRHERFTENM